MKVLKGLILIYFGYAFAVLETKYFGSNYWPESAAELICDLLALTIVLYGMLKLFEGIKEISGK